jgi:hypothetical protein
MFPLVGPDYPKAADELAARIQAGLGELLTFPRGQTVVVIQGGSYPDFENVKVNLTGASVNGAVPPPPPKPTGPREPGPTAAELHIVGKPINYQGRGINLELTASGAKFDLSHDEKGRAMLVAREAEGGNVVLDIAAADLQFILKTAATEAAKKKGVSIQDLDVNLTNQGPRTVDVQVRVKAKKMVMSGTVVVKGRLEIDDALVAKVSNLSCDGQGVMGNMAAGMIQGALRAQEGRRFLLTNFSLGALALRDVKISTANGLSISAAVGRKSA